MKKVLYIFLLLFPCVIISAQKLNSDRNDMTYLFIEALKNKTFGNINQSGYLLTKYTNVDSTCAACYFELSKLYFTSGSIENALICAKKSYEIDEKNYWYVKNYADLVRINKNYPLAYNLYKNLVSNFDAKIEDKFFLAEVCLVLRKDKEGLSILNEIEAANGINEKISIEKYKFYLVSKDYNNALKSLNNLLLIFPDSSYLYGLIAEFYASRNKKVEAKKYFEKYIVLEPYNANALYAYGKYLLHIDDSVYSLKIFIKLFNNDSILVADKINVLKKIILENYGNSKDKLFFDCQIQKLIESYDSIPLVNELICDYYERNNEIEKALVSSKKLVNALPKTTVYWERLFFYFNLNHNYDSIIYYSNFLTKVFPNRPFLFLISGVANFQKQQYVNAGYFFKSGLELVDNNNELQYQFINFLAETYYKMQKLDSAYYYFELAIENEKADIVLFNNYAYYLAENSDKLIRALELSRLTLIKYPKSSTFLDTYAWICYKMKNYQEAYKYIKLAYKYSKTANSEIIDHYGDILYCIGNESKAKNMWFKAKKINNSPKMDVKINSFKCP